MKVYPCKKIDNAQEFLLTWEQVKAEEGVYMADAPRWSSSNPPYFLTLSNEGHSTAARILVTLCCDGKEIFPASSFWDDFFFRRLPSAKVHFAITDGE